MTIITELISDEYIAHDTKAPTTTASLLDSEGVISCCDAFHQAVTEEVNRLGLSEEIEISQPLAKVMPPTLVLKGRKEAVESLQKSSSDFAHIALKI